MPDSRSYKQYLILEKIIQRYSNCDKWLWGFKYRNVQSGNLLRDTRNARHTSPYASLSLNSLSSPFIPRGLLQNPLYSLITNLQAEKLVTSIHYFSQKYRDTQRGGVVVSILLQSHLHDILARHYVIFDNASTKLGNAAYPLFILCTTRNNPRVLYFRYKSSRVVSPREFQSSSLFALWSMLSRLSRSLPTMWEIAITG